MQTNLAKWITKVSQHICKIIYTDSFYLHDKNPEFSLWPLHVRVAQNPTKLSDVVSTQLVNNLRLLPYQLFPL